MASPRTEAPKAPAKGPDFTLKPAALLDAPLEGKEGLEAVLAPNQARTRSVAREELTNNLLALQENPGMPFEVAHYAARPGTAENPSGARKIVAQILLAPGEKGRIATPPSATEDVKGYYDVEWRNANYGGSDRDGSVVIAMWVVE